MFGEGARAMTTGGSEFPIRGVVGVVGGSDDEVRRQLARLEELPGIAGVEVRADLFTSCAAALHMLRSQPVGSAHPC